MFESFAATPTEKTPLSSNTPLTAEEADFFEQDGTGIFIPKDGVEHREDEYDLSGFELLREMQTKHFWYCGRHRFLLHALRQLLGDREHWSTETASLIDLGGGCGGWIHYLENYAKLPKCELALADSSTKALDYAAETVGSNVTRYQVDLLNLPWEDRWDVIFLLDVLEHIPDDLKAMREACTALKPGGLLFVTTPALNAFWSYNDELVHHVRRYSRRDFSLLAENAGFSLVKSRYFMFLLSPLLYLSRLRTPQLADMDAEQQADLLRRTHQLPSAPVNLALKAVFSSETPWGWWLPFPWGTSILGVFQKLPS